MLICKKILFFCFISAIAFLTLSGCSPKEKDKKITIKVWESGNGPDEFIKQAGELYSKLNPGIVIEYENVEVGSAVGRLIDDGPDGIGPDLFACPHDKLGDLVSKNLVLPTVDPNGVKKEVIPSCYNSQIYNGTMFGYPVSAETYVLFYNKKFLSKKDVPTSWYDLRNWVKEFNLKNPGKQGFVMEVGAGYYTYIFTTAKENRLFGPDGCDTRSTYMQTKEAAIGMTAFKSLRDVVYLSSDDLTTEKVESMFKNGLAAMTITGMWNIRAYEDAGVDFGVAVLPSLPTETRPATSFCGTRAMYVSSYSAHPQEAADFARFLLTPEMQQLRFNLTGSLPAIETIVNNRYTDAFYAQLNYSFPMPSVPQMSVYWDAMNKASANIWDGADIYSELYKCNEAVVGK